MAAAGGSWKGSVFVPAGMATLKGAENGVIRHASGAYNSAVRSATIGVEYTRGDPMFRGGSNLPELLTREQIEARFRSELTFSRYGGYRQMPLTQADLNRVVRDIARDIGRAVGVRRAFGIKATNTVTPRQIALIGRGIARDHNQHLQRLAEAQGRA